MAHTQTFGQRLRELRKTKGLTQRDLAKLVADRLKADDKRGFDFTYLSKIENDKNPPPSTDAIIQLAEVLETNADELIGLAGKVPPDLGDQLKASGGARTFFRSAVDANLTEEDWKDLLERLKKKKKK